MYSNLFGLNEYILVNRRMIKVCGLIPAIYLSEIIESVKTAVTMNAYNPLTGFIRINRSQIEENTTIKISDQYELDRKWANLGIIQISNIHLDDITVDLELLTAMLVENDREVLAAASKAFGNRFAMKKNANEDKKNSIKKGLQKFIKFDDSDLVIAMTRWIDSCVDGKTLTKVSVESFQDKIMNYTSSKAIQLELINIAAEKVYVYADYAINVYESLHRQNFSNTKNSSATHLKDQKVATGLSNQTF